MIKQKVYTFRVTGWILKPGLCGEVCCDGLHPKCEKYRASLKANERRMAISTVTIHHVNGFFAAKQYARSINLPDSLWMAGNVLPIVVRWEQING